MQVLSLKACAFLHLQGTGPVLELACFQVYKYASATGRLVHESASPQLTDNNCNQIRVMHSTYMPCVNRSCCPVSGSLLETEN